MLDCVSGYNDSSGHAYPGQCRSPLIRSSSDNSTWDIYCVLMIGWTHPGAAHPRWAHAGDDGGFDWLLLLFLVMIAQSARAEISGTFCLATWECWYKAIRVRQVCNFRRSPDWPSCRLLHWPCDTGSFPISTSFGQWSIGNESSLSDIVSVHWQLSWSYDRHPVPILCNWEAFVCRLGGAAAPDSFTRCCCFFATLMDIILAYFGVVLQLLMMTCQRTRERKLRDV